MKVPFFDLKQQYEQLKEEILPAMEQVAASGMYASGRTVEIFEREFARYVGARNAVAVSSGTDALLLALRACGVKPGDEVITPANTFFATIGAIHHAGAVPVLADIYQDTFNINSQGIEALITEKTKAIIPVHLYGLPCNMEEIDAVAQKHKLSVIQDACQAHGAGYNHSTIGSSGTACFSFYPTKNLGAFGEGGMVVTSSDGMAQTVAELRHHGGARNNVHDEFGYNARMDELQAAVLHVKLKHLDKWVANRRAIAARYTEGLKDVVKCPTEPKGSLHAYHLYVIRTEQRDELKAHLLNRGVGTAVHYPCPVHFQFAFKDGYGDQKVNCPVAERVSGEILSLPMFPELRDEQVDYVVEQIREFFQR